MSVEDDEDPESGGRVAGTVRRHIPLDTRDPPGAILHFYVGDSYDPNRYVEFNFFNLMMVVSLPFHVFYIIVQSEL